MKLPKLVTLSGAPIRKLPLEQQEQELALWEQLESERLLYQRRFKEEQQRTKQLLKRLEKIQKNQPKPDVDRYRRAFTG